MILDEIAVQNFGVFQGLHTITLTPPSNSKPIILFGGYNGSGKTTLLDALQLVLYGKFARCSNRGNISYEEFLNRSIHRTADSQERTSVELKFRNMSNGKDHTYSIRRIWSRKRHGIHEYLVVIKDGALDRVLTEEWDQYVEEYIPSRISNLFFFDGEKIEEFASSTNASQLLFVAIHSLLGMDIIDQLLNDMIVLERRKRVSLKNDTERKEFDNAMVKIEELDKQKGDLVQDRASLQNDLEQEEKNYRNIENIFRREGGVLLEKRKEIETQKISTKEHLYSVEEKLREFSSGPIPFLLIIDMLRAVEHQDQREERAYQAQAFTDTLKERDKKLLRIAKQHQTPETIIEKIGNFLSEDRDQRIKETQTERYLNLDNETKKNLKMLLASILPEARHSAIKQSSEVKKSQANLDDIERKLAGVPAEDSIAPLIEERHKIKMSIEKIKSRIENIDNEIAKISREKEQKQSWLAFQLEKVVKDDFYQEDVGRIAHYSKLVRETLKKFRNTMLLNHVEKIGELIFDSFGKLIRKKSLIKNISINPDNYELELRGADGKTLSPERLSAGERQLLAVSILWGLARASGRPLPTAIDTPLGRLDSSHRNHIVERYFPYASHQVLLFSTDEEINQRYFEKLKPYIGRTYLLEFDDHNGSTQIRDGYFW